MKMRPFLIILQRPTESTVAVLTGKCDALFATSDEIMDAIVTSITEWVRKDPEGRDLWKRSGHDLNVGDLGSYGIDLALDTFLKKHSVFDLKVDIFSESDYPHNYMFDTVLVDADEIEV